MNLVEQLAPGLSGIETLRALMPAGYMATLLDSGCGCALHSMLAADQMYTTLELKVAFHRPITIATGRIRAEGRAEGRAVSVGRRAAFAEAKLVDLDGRLLASATPTLLVMSSVAG